MKFSTVALITMLLIGSLSAGAKVNSPRPFFLDREITLNGAVVPEGMYSLSVETQGSSVRVTLSKEGRFIATAHGTWVRHGVKYAQDAVLLRINSDGTHSLIEIRLAGDNKTIVLDSERPALRIAPAPDRSSGNSVPGTPTADSSGAGFSLWG